MAKTGRKHHRINDVLLRKLWPTRLSDAEIALRLGHSPSVLHRRARKLGLLRRRDIWKKDNLA